MGDFRGRGRAGGFSMIWQGSAGVFEAPPGTPVPSAPYCPSFFTTVGKPPRGSRGPDKGNRRSWRVAAQRLRMVKWPQPGPKK